MGPDAVAIVPGASLVSRSADTHYPFRQDSDFWYLTGFAHPDATAIFSTLPDRPAYTLWVQPRDPAAETWTGYRPGLEGAVADYGADEAGSSDDLAARLPEIVEGASRLYHGLGRRPALDQKLIAVQDALRLQSRRGAAPATQWIDPRSILHEMRLIKSPEEVELMREAADITRQAHEAAAHATEAGRLEYEIEATLDHVFRSRGGWGPAYSSIVAGGANAAVLHYVANDQPLKAGDLLLIDAGCEFQGYASDVTRTYPVGGRFEGPGRDLYAVVLAAQEATIAAAGPGTSLPTLHALACRKLVEGMLAIGLMEGDADEIIESESYRNYYMHGTSHWLGLDVHDVGSYTEDGKPRSLEPGMAFTVEPGLYVPQHNEDAPEAFRGMGVRIEDDLVITAEGCENLNTAIPKQMADIESQVGGRP